MRHRLLISAAAAAAIGAIVGGATVADASGTSGSPNHPGKSTAPVHATAADPRITRAAALLGVSPGRLRQALPAAKRAATASPLSGAAAAAALAEQLHITRTQAEQALTYLFGAPRRPNKTPSPAPDPAISGLATQLGISQRRAQWVFDQLNRMARPGHGVDPNTPAFAGLAAALGRTPTHLAHALDQWKQGLRATSPSPTPTASPTP